MIRDGVGRVPGRRTALVISLVVGIAVIGFLVLAAAPVLLACSNADEALERAERDHAVVADVLRDHLTTTPVALLGTGQCSDSRRVLGRYTYDAPAATLADIESELLEAGFQQTAEDTFTLPSDEEWDSTMTVRAGGDKVQLELWVRI